MNSSAPRWDVIGVAFTLVTAFTGIVITIIYNSDPQLRLIGVIVTLISLVVLAIIYRMYRVSKEITYQVISDTTVLSVIEAPEVKGRVKILLDNKPVKDVHVVVLRIWNSGTMPIERKDYDNNRPIQVDFGDEAEVLEAEVLDATTRSLKNEAAGSLKWDEKSVMLEPLVLNRKTSITLKTLVH
jgi:hypothetical protein